MIINKWTKWIPLDGLSKKYSLESIVDNEGLVNIVLIDIADDKKKLHIDFHNPRVFSYKKTDLRFKKHTLNELDKIYGSTFTNEWTFFKINNSSYVQELMKKSYEIFGIDISLHIIFLTTDTLLEVIPYEEPTFTFIENER